MFSINTFASLEREVMIIGEIICVISPVAVAVHLPQTHSMVRTEKPQVYSMWERK